MVRFSARSTGEMFLLIQYTVGISSHCCVLHSHMETAKSCVGLASVFGLFLQECLDGIGVLECPSGGATPNNFCHFQFSIQIQHHIAERWGVRSYK